MKLQTPIPDDLPVPDTATAAEPSLTLAPPEDVPAPEVAPTTEPVMMGPALEAVVENGTSTPKVCKVELKG